PYGQVRFIPTGGINAGNLAEYIMFPKVLACGGSWMVKDDLIKAGKFDEITRLTREAIGVLLGFSVAHVGINMPDAEASLQLARQLADLFQMPLKEGNSSNFAGAGVEVNKAQGLGAHGHIAVLTNSIDRAVAFMERQGAKADPASAKQDPAGNTIAVYLQGEFGGFAVHLLQRK
ncbi:MAG: keto-hydroxyglutarate-aldolase/keto-deoxy-phosphogluconate aldolase, partial [Lentisphaerae bacterium]|nr:keto-hydroxyglutarate-aldolase/keto-deoxy-phosphogluconate aldolase [Lentisphaerota bacterium]